MTKNRNENENNYRKIIIIILLLFCIVVFSIMIIYELSKKGFTESKISSTELNYDWYENDTSSVIANDSSNVEQDTSKQLSTESINTKNTETEPSTTFTDEPDPDSTARRPWFSLEKIPNDIQAKLNIEEIKNNIQDMLYAQAYQDYKTAVYEEHKENESYIELWFSVKAKPNNVSVQVLYYGQIDTAIVRLYDE